MRKRGFLALSILFFLLLGNPAKTFGWYAEDRVTNDNIEPYEIHYVTEGETLWKIAGLYHVSLNELIKLNADLENPDLIYPSDQIKIPVSKIQGVYIHIE